MTTPNPLSPEELARCRSAFETWWSSDGCITTESSAWVAWQAAWSAAQPHASSEIRVVSLEKCAKALYRATTGRKWSMLTRQEQREPFHISAKAVLDAAGVKYVD